MAYTQSDIDALKRAIATGASKVRFADGREVTYRSLEQMKETLRDMEAEVSPTTVQPRTTFVEHSRD